MKNVPERIYLNLGQMSEGEWEEVKDQDFDQLRKEWEITWCEDKVFEHDIEYVRKDAAEDGKRWHYYNDEKPTEEGLLAVVFFGVCFETRISFKVADGTFHFDATEDGYPPLAWMRLPDLSEEVLKKIMKDI